MKTGLQLFGLLALMAVAGTIYNFANSGNPVKYLAWVDKRYDQEEKPPAPGKEPKSDAKTEPPEFPMIGFGQAFDEFKDGTTFVDARRTADYEKGHIPGAVSISAHEADLYDKISNLREGAVFEAPVVVYCSISKECEDSKLVARQLKEAGFLNLVIFLGGFPEWEKEKPDLVAKGKEPGSREKQ